MRALVTGAEGFIGKHLTVYLLENGYEVWASTQENKSFEEVNATRYVKCDIRNIDEINDAVGLSMPDVIYHLAAQSYPTVSWEKPNETIETNAIGTCNLFESVIKHDIDPKIIVACSSAEYGFVERDEVPVSEDHSLMPLHPYGVSKVAQDLLTYQYYKNNGIRGIRARIFNTTGPGKVKDVVSDFTKRIAECEGGHRPEFIHGNLDAQRDITDVRDMVRALHFCEKAGDGQAYNLCSMKAETISDILKRLLDLSEKTINTRAEPSLMRPTDEPIIMGDNTKFKKATGWEPKINIQKTLEDTLEYWRQKLN